MPNVHKRNHIAYYVCGFCHDFTQLKCGKMLGVIVCPFVTSKNDVSMVLCGIATSA